MDFLPKTAHLQGGNPQKARNTPNLANNAKPTDGKTPPYTVTHKPNYHAHTFQSFLRKKT